MKRGTPTHPKAQALAAELKIPIYAAVGLLEMLWHFAAQYAHAGDVGRFDDDAIARALCWTDASFILVSALLKTGWLEKCPCHRLRVHDWPDHADQTVRRVLLKRGQEFLKCYSDASIKLASASTELEKTSQPLPLPLPLPLPTTTTPAPKARVKKLPRKQQQPDGRANTAWGLWVDACRSQGRSDPKPVPQDLAAAKALFKIVPDREELAYYFRTYLKDTTPFFANAGWPLARLKSAVNKYGDRWADYRAKCAEIDAQTQQQAKPPATVDTGPPVDLNSELLDIIEMAEAHTETDECKPKT